MMRSWINHLLLVAMIVAESLRGINDIRLHIRWLHRKADLAKKNGNLFAARSWTHRAQEWAVLAAVCAIAVVPTLYYAAHAAVV